MTVVIDRYSAIPVAIRRKRRVFNLHVAGGQTVARIVLKCNHGTFDSLESTAVRAIRSAILNGKRRILNVNIWTADITTVCTVDQEGAAASHFNANRCRRIELQALAIDAPGVLTVDSKGRTTFHYNVSVGSINGAVGGAASRIRVERERHRSTIARNNGSVAERHSKPALILRLICNR
ncbi:hypothetical protein [Enorma phocaeensis]|uniref:hypothetical protein n=1 Tax=Enorma phocaeensis TaxID=1871019 RepID=UPI002356DEC7|nr:hypothetical protein [Enorma phocaeensis]